MMARLAAVTAVIAVGAGCAAPGRPVPGASPKAFAAMGLSFRYPGGWRAATWYNDVSSFSALIVALSTAPPKNPCTVAAGGGQGASTACGEPAGPLPAGGILVTWSADGFPGWRPPAANATVGGRPARQTRVMGGWCTALGGTATLTVVVPRTAPGNWYQMDACLRGPGLARDEAQLAAMLASVRIAGDP